MRRALVTAFAAFLTGTAQAPEYTIEAIRYATVPQFPLSVLVADAPEEQRADLAMAIWLVRGGGRNILFDTGFYREEWMERFDIVDFITPDSAVRLAGIDPAAVTDVIISHAHWDHIGGIDLFPNATIWIQEGEYEYYTGAAWQEGGLNGGIDPADMVSLLRRNTEGQVRLIAGDDVEIIPGIRVFTGGRHTFASQYVLVGGEPPYILASDNCYMYLNLELHSPVATFTPEDRESNLAAFDRMLSIVGTPDRIIPGHDPEQFVRFPSEGRIARIK